MAGPTDEYEDADDLSDADEMRADTAAIRADIRETRERMSQTLDGIGDRLNPQHIKQQVKQNIRDATIGRAEHMARNVADRATETRRGVVDAIRDNPIPAAMVGIGLGWLLYNGRRAEETPNQAGLGYWTGSDGQQGPPAPGIYDEPSTMDRATDWAAGATSGVRDRAQELTGRAQETVGDLAGRAQETVGDLAGRTRQATSQMADRAGEMLGDTASRARAAAGSLAEQTRYQSGRLEHRFHDAIAESPLVVGAAVIALGITAGMAIPSTRRESELMGARRDELFDRARDMAQETTGKVQQVAQRVATEARSTVSEVASDIRSTVTEAAQDLQTTAREAVQEQGLMGSGGGSTGARTGAAQTDSFRSGSQSGSAQTGSAQSGASQTGGTQTSAPLTGSSQTGSSQTGGSQTGSFGAGSSGGSIADPRRV
jgi:gas vesicle protein/uncharacterized protein YjbJ (UPF0337 family)